MEGLIKSMENLSAMVGSLAETQVITGQHGHLQIEDTTSQ
jgi:hypothetical protein